ncbi:MAG TPA: cytochrome c [Thermodesulfobacteriota bacterium]|nr:cytochrome c [Thermodesulfobacteriota bacterium]
MRWLLSISMIISLLLFFSSLSTVLGKDPTPPKKTPELLTQGKKVYEQNCSPCHGPKGNGKGPAGAVLTPPPTDFTKPYNQWPASKGDLKKVFEVIANGVPNTSMVKWGHLPEQERWALVYTVLEFSASAKSLPKKK